MPPPCARARVLGRYHKRLLPNYGVFDEQRWFVPGDGPPPPFVVAGVPVGITICEDMWVPGGRWPARPPPAPACWSTSTPPPTHAAGGRSGWPCWAERVAETGCPVVYVNQVGGQDELVFDGASLVMGPDGTVVASARQFVDEVLLVDLDVDLAGPADTADRGSADTGGVVGHHHLEPAGGGPRPGPGGRRPRPRGRGLPGAGARAPATTWARTGSPTRSSGSPAASTPPWWRPSPSTPWARSTCTGSPCRPATRARDQWPTR